jgi:hypothetical protein
MIQKNLIVVLFLLGLSCIQSKEIIENFKLNSNKISCPMLSEKCQTFVAVKNSLKFNITMLKRYLFLEFFFFDKFKRIFE